MVVTAERLFRNPFANEDLLKSGRLAVRITACFFADSSQIGAVTNTLMPAFAPTGVRPETIAAYAQ